MSEPSDEEVRAHFETRAATYDEYWLGTGRLAGHERPGFADEVERLVALVRSLPAARVLDVACGTGFLTRHLQGDVVALDRSAAMVEIAAERMPGVEVVHGDALPLPFPDGRFDRVFTSLFFHHLRPDDRAAFLAEARRVGGELVVIETAHASAEEPGAHGAEHGHPNQGPRRGFTAAELAAELGGARVLHDGPWFAVVTDAPVT